MGLNETFGSQGTGNVTAATNKMLSMKFGQGVTSSFKKDWQSQITSSASAQKDWYNSMDGGERTAFKSDNKLAALQASAGTTSAGAAKTHALEQKIGTYFKANGEAGPLSVGGAYELAKKAGFNTKQAVDFSTKYGKDFGSSVGSDHTLEKIKKGGIGQKFTNSLKAASTAGAKYSYAQSNKSGVGASAFSAFFTAFDKNLLAEHPNLTRGQLNAANVKEDQYLRTPAGQKYAKS